MNQKITKSELKREFEEEIEQLRDQLRRCIRTGGEFQARMTTANEIEAIVNFAAKLELITWDEATAINTEIGLAAAMGEFEEDPA